jgi:hypothetical protein
LSLPAINRLVVEVLDEVIAFTGCCLGPDNGLTEVIGGHLRCDTADDSPLTIVIVGRSVCERQAGAARRYVVGNPVVRG